MNLSKFNNVPTPVQIFIWVWNHVHREQCIAAYCKEKCIFLSNKMTDSLPNFQCLLYCALRICHNHIILEVCTKQSQVCDVWQNLVKGQCFVIEKKTSIIKSDIFLSVQTVSVHNQTKTMGKSIKLINVFITVCNLRIFVWILCSTSNYCNWKKQGLSSGCVRHLVCW